MGHILVALAWTISKEEEHDEPSLQGDAIILGKGLRGAAGAHNHYGTELNCLACTIDETVIYNDASVNIRLH